MVHMCVHCTVYSIVHIVHTDSFARISKRFRSSGIDSMESIPRAYVALARICKPFKEPRNRFPA
jgi:hypothetical protein